jgi:hypothetical protein
VPQFLQDDVKTVGLKRQLSKLGKRGLLRKQRIAFGFSGLREAPVSEGACGCLFCGSC